MAIRKLSHVLAGAPFFLSHPIVLNMEAQFQSFSELEPGDRWKQLFDHLWPVYRKWFLKEGDAARPTYLECERALKKHMPELVPSWQRLVDLAGGGDQQARFLAMYCPTAYMSGCSQAVWLRDDPVLVRNYDYSPRLWEGTLLHSRWNRQRVIAMIDCLWGALDGINESGLAVSLAFGGRRIVGTGFGIPLILRYVLEFCDSAADAVAVLLRVPSHMAYNVTVADATGDHATVFLSPDREPVVSRRQLATNHQDAVEWDEHARVTATLDRAHFLSLRLQDQQETRERFVSRFLEPPLYQTRHNDGWGTLYTAVYDPRRKQASFRWPGYELDQPIDAFTDQTLVLRFGV